jgi:hypothetical protein
VVIISDNRSKLQNKPKKNLFPDQQRDWWLLNMPFDISFTAAKLQCCSHMTQIWFLPRSSNGSVPKVNSETIEKFRSWFPVTKFCFRDVAKSPEKIISCRNATTVRYSTNKVFMLKITTVFDYSQCTTEYGWNTSKSHPCDFFLSMCDVKIFLTFTSPNMVLLWQLFYLFCSCI